MLSSCCYHLQIRLWLILMQNLFDWLIDFIYLGTVAPSVNENCFQGAVAKTLISNKIDNTKKTFTYLSVVIGTILAISSATSSTTSAVSSSSKSTTISSSGTTPWPPSLMWLLHWNFKHKYSKILQDLVLVAEGWIIKSLWIQKRLPNYEITQAKIILKSNWKIMVIVPITYRHATLPIDYHQQLQFRLPPIPLMAPLQTCPVEHHPVNYVVWTLDWLRSVFLLRLAVL